MFDFDEMRTPCDQSEPMLKGYGGDPDIILGQRSPFEAQTVLDLSVAASV
jgi:hypothetical protein